MWRLVAGLACGLVLDASQAPRAEEVPSLNPDGISHYSRWSPDGSRIAFSSTRHGNWELYVVGTDGTDLVRLTRNTTDDVFPTWSPDGERIAFSSTATGFSPNLPSQSAIFVIDADGKNRRRLTNTEVGLDNPVPYYNDTVPIWSPDGTKIAFLSDRRNGYREVFLMNPDGTGITRVTFNKAHHWNPGWTPDAKRIVFDARLDGLPTANNNPVAGMYSVNASGPSYSYGLDPHPVLNDTESGLEFDSSISADGRWIAFLNGQVDPTRRTGRRGLTFAELRYVDGKPEVIEETMRQVDDEEQYWPDWSPDGTRITFTSTRDGHPEVYVSNIDGTGLQRLTFSRPQGSQPQ